MTSTTSPATIAGIVELIRAAAQDLDTLTPDARRAALAEIDADLAQCRD